MQVSTCVEHAKKHRKQFAPSLFVDVILVILLVWEFLAKSFQMLFGKEWIIVIEVYTNWMTFAKYVKDLVEIQEL